MILSDTDENGQEIVL